MARRPLLSILFALTLIACDDGAADDAGPPPREDAGPPDAGPEPVRLCDPDFDPGPFPAPDAWAPNRGPGGPARTFTAGELFNSCAFLDGGPMDEDHHNLVTMFDGYLLMPWAPCYLHGGGLTFWEFDDPCNPVMVGTSFSMFMRETHSIGFSQEGGRWAVVDEMTMPLPMPLEANNAGGIQFWDISDPTAPAPVSELHLTGFGFLDAYARVSVSVFWQVPYVYVGGTQNGIWIVDATDPTNPRQVGQYGFEPLMQVGQVQVVGNVLIASSFEGERAVLLDVSDPLDPQPIPGGDFTLEAEGQAREVYFSNVVGGRLFAANKEGGGGFFVYDIRDPENPSFVGSNISDGNSGYVFAQQDTVFVGESSFAGVYDISDMSNITEIVRLNHVGDLDTATPVGNVVVLSADEDAVDGEGSAVAPFAEAPDSVAPSIGWVWPPDGATNIRTTSRFGVSFDELIEIRSAHEGSLRLYRTGMDPDETRVPAAVSAQEAIANVHPRCPLEPNTEYTLEIMAGGVEDWNGNALETSMTVSFTTGVE